jgi:hypothetical protein
MNLPVWFWPNTPIVSVVKFKSGYYGVRITRRLLWLTRWNEFVDSNGKTIFKCDEAETILSHAQDRLRLYWIQRGKAERKEAVKSDAGRVITKMECMQ